MGITFNGRIQAPSGRLHVGQPPAVVWATPAGSLGGVEETRPFTGQVTATGSGGPLSYAVVGGSLPAGLTLSPTGQITGTAARVAGTGTAASTFTVRATNTLRGLSADRTFAIDVANRVRALHLAPGQYAIAPDTASLRITGNVAVAAWLKITDRTLAQQALLWKLNSFGIGLNIAGLANASHLTFAVYDGTMWREAAIPRASVPVNTWFHVAGAYDQSNVVLYLNGSVVATQNYGTAKPVVTNANRMVLNGAENNGITYSVSTFAVRDVMVGNFSWGGASQVQDAMANGFQPGLPANRRLIWDMVGDDLTDISQHGNHGTLTGGSFAAA